MDSVTFNDSRIPLFPTCSQDKEVRELIDDEAAGMCYEVFIPCGISRDQAISRFKQLQKERELGLWKNNFALRLQVEENLNKIPTPTPIPKTTGGEILEGIFGLMTLGMFTGTACAPVPVFPQPGGILEKGQWRFRVDLRGDPRIGEVYFMRQIHFPHSTLVSWKMINKDEKNLKAILEIGMYQTEILKGMERWQPKNLFLEGLDRDFLAPSREGLQEFLGGDYKQLVDYIREETDPEKLRLKNYLFLAIMGAGLVYALNHEEVSLHKVMTPTEAQSMEKLLLGLKEKHGDDLEEVLQDPVFKEVIVTQREAWATREIIHFLEENPGQELVLVFGSNHNFCDDFLRAGVTPNILSLWLEDPDTLISAGQNLPEACR